MRKFAQLLCMMFLMALPALAADVAVLRNGFTIRHERRQELGGVTRLYLTADSNGYTDVPTSEIDHFEQDLSPAPAAAQPAAPVPVAAAAPRASVSPSNPSLPTPAPHVDLKDVVASASTTHLIDPDLIASVIHAESNFNPHAISPKGARGLMQLMPQTASRLGVNNSFDPQANVDGGTRYLRELLELYNFDLIKALAAYNAGPHRVQQYNGVPRIILDFNRKKLAEDKAAAAAAKLAANKPAAKTPMAKTSSTKPSSKTPPARTIISARSAATQPSPTP